MITAKPRWLLSNDFCFFQDGVVIGQVSLPWSFYLLEYGRAVLLVGQDSYEITNPRREATLLVSREIGMELFKGETKVADLRHAFIDTTEQSQVTWDERSLTCQLKGIGCFEFKEKETVVGTVRTDRIFSRVRRIEFDSSIPLIIQILCFWGTVRKTV